MIPRKLLVIIGLMFFISACGPIFSATLPGPIFISTDTLTPTPTPTPTVSSIVSPTASIGFTLVPTGSYFTMTRDSNCYNGPGVIYTVVTILRSGETIDVIGRNSDSSWWRIVKGPSTDCWVANEAGTFNGELALIPITSSQYITKTVIPPSPTRERQIDATNTSRPSINTFVPATSTLRPTSTSRPATNTPRPKTNTPIPPPPATNTEPPPPTDPPTEPPPPTDPPTDPPTEPPPPTDPPTEPPAATEPPAVP
jgi:hypothetical protein